MLCCAVDGCDNETYKRAMCRAHHADWQKSILPPGLFEGRPGLPSLGCDRTCLVEGCGKRVASRRLCSTHYNRWRTTGTTDLPVKQQTVCSEPDCGGAVAAKGMCSRHYNRVRNQRQKGSVGGPTRRDLTGARVGKTLVVDKTAEGSWNCVCDCGVLFVRAHDKLMEAVKHSRNSYCGTCLVGVDAKSVIASQVHKSYKGGALGRELEFDLTVEQVSEIIFQPCHYCGLVEDKQKHGIYYCGIDRQLNHIHYTPLNVVPCCWTCNKLKGSMDLTKWLDWLDRVSKFQLKTPTPKMVAA